MMNAASRLDAVHLRRFEEDGFLVLDRVLAVADLAELRAEADRLLATAVERGGARNALGKSLRFAELADPADAGALPDLVRAVLGERARATKLTIFDKTPNANWKVPWHQDLTIALRERRKVEGFGPWSVKDGVPHVQPPAALLERILAIRLHLDATPEENGALRVVPGSHRLGRLTAEAIAELVQRRGLVTCPLPAGGAMLMRPLLVHASSTAHAFAHRRVLHFEFCAEPLPHGLEWV